MFSGMFALWTIATSWAAPAVLVVGLHVPGRTGEKAAADAARLADALDATAKVDALAPLEVSQKISGREALVIDTYALGPGRERLREGKVLYDRAQPDQAIPVLQQAVTQLQGALALSTDSRDLHEALMLLGMSHVGLGDEDAAKSVFRTSIILDPTRQLDSVRYPPRVVQLFDQVRDEITRSAPAHLGVDANGPATFWVDGRRVGDGATAEVTLVGGTHHVLARAEDGRTYFQTVKLSEGASQRIDARLAPRSLGVPEADVGARARQTRELYKSLGAYTDRAVVVLAGVTPTGQVALQLYSPATGSFSRAMTGEAGDDPVGAAVDLAPSLVAMLGETGDVRADRVSPQVLPLDVSANDVLASMLFDPPDSAPAVVVERGKSRWWLWAGLGAVVAGGGAAAVVVATTQDDGTGTVTFGPIP